VVADERDEAARLQSQCLEGISVAFDAEQFLIFSVANREN
jgi:hypothetical protein